MSVALLVIGVVAGAQARATTYAPGADKNHPYSNPVWYPLAAPAVMGCYKSNGTKPIASNSDTCTTTQVHLGWQLDLVSTQTSHQSVPVESVYAMGAGIVHYGSTDPSCGGASSRGKWIYIDHGNGTLSYYGHLGVIAVTNGEYVTAHTRIGTVGNSGYSGCKSNPWLRYLYLAVKTGGTSGQYVEIKNMYTCVVGKEASWPKQLTNPDNSLAARNSTWNQRAPWQVWNDVPSHEQLDAPDTNRNCVPATVATPNAPAGEHVAPAGTGKLKVTWTKPTTRVTLMLVELQEWHPSLPAYLDYGTPPRIVSATATSYTFSGLPSGKTWRVRTSFYNSVGWSAPSAWTTSIKTT